MIPILDLSGLTANVITAVTASGIAPELASFVVTRLNVLPSGSYARIKVFDETEDYSSEESCPVVATNISSRQTRIEVTQIPQPL
jgi:hypothetical protein